jgi:bacteriorhodopsin
MVVAAGETFRLPLGPFTTPTPWSILSDVALALVQLKLAVCPGPILLGLATSVTLRILIVAEAEAVTPPSPVAVAVYVVVAAGTIAVEPESATDVTSSPRTDGVIVTEVEFALSQVSVVLWPAATMLGETLKDIVGAEPAGTTVTVIEFVAVLPFASVAVAMYVVVCVGETVADPDMSSAPEVTGGEMENDAPLVTFQVMVVFCP